MSSATVQTIEWLGREISLNRVAFSLFGRFDVYWYGILFGLAFVVAALYILRRCRAFGLDGDRVIDVLLGAVLGGLIGARLYYVVFSWDYYKDDLRKIFSVREGGIAIYGSLIGAILAILLLCRLRRVKFLPLTDLFFSALLIGQAIGRWGNFINIEAFGSITEVSWGMRGDAITAYLKAVGLLDVTATGNPAVHPTFLYESLWCLLGFIVLALYTKRRRYDGELSLLYLLWYGAGRFFIEGLRTDSLMLGTVRVSQVVAAASVVAALALLVVNRRKIKAANDPGFMPLYVNTEEGKSVLAGTFYRKDDGKAGETADGKAEETADGAPEETADSTPEETADSTPEETADGEAGSPMPDAEDDNAN